MLLPAGLSEADEEHWIRRMLDRLAAKEQRRRPSDDDLLDRAQKATGQGITETIRQGLRLVAAGETFRRVSQLRGSVRFSLDLDRLREDRGDRR